jgi:hypothetical protein
VPPPNRAYLRTLIHNSDLEHLEKVVLDGHGHKLLHESSAIGKVTKFLATLPDFMDTISILHNAVTAGVVPVSYVTFFLFLCKGRGTSPSYT